MPTKLFRKIPLAFAVGLIASMLFAGVAIAAKIADADHGGRLLTATLSGANEIPPADPDGTGFARVTLNQGQGEVCFDLSYENIDAPTMAHIHRGTADVNGPIVVWFGGPPPPGVDNFSDTGCTSGVDRALIKEIRQSPENFYVNIHNMTFPGGAIRGQLSK